MSSFLTTVTITRLEEVASDNGFDQALPREGEWLGFASTQAPLRLWLSTFGEAQFIAAFSQLSVARALGEYGTPIASSLPAGATGGSRVHVLPTVSIEVLGWEVSR